MDLLHRGITLEGDFKYYGTITTDKKDQLVVPEPGTAAGIEFIPQEGDMRNEHVQLLIVNNSAEKNSQSLSIYRKSLFAKEPFWCIVDTIDITHGTKEIMVTIHADGSAQIGDETFLVTSRSLELDSEC